MNQKVVTQNFIIEPTGDKYFSINFSDYFSSRLRNSVNISSVKKYLFSYCMGGHRQWYHYLKLEIVSFNFFVILLASSIVCIKKQLNVLSR